MHVLVDKIGVVMRRVRSWVNRTCPVGRNVTLGGSDVPVADFSSNGLQGGTRGLARRTARL